MNQHSSPSGRPADPNAVDRIRIAVNRMILGFPLTGVEPPTDVAAAYVAELASLPPEAVEEACRRFSRGLVERKAKGLRPGIDLVYELASELADKAARESRLRLPAPPRDRPETAEEKATKAQRTTELLGKWAQRDLDRIKTASGREAG